MGRSLPFGRGNRGNWAGFERALDELSDTAFKVFAQVCLRARRADGCLEFERDGLARQVGKSRSTLGRCLHELEAKGICALQAAPNQHRRSRLKVCPQYWPYEVAGQPEAEPSEQPVADVGTYVTEVRRIFCQSASVQGRFGPADERLVADACWLCWAIVWAATG